VEAAQGSDCPNGPPFGKYVGKMDPHGTTNRKYYYHFQHYIHKPTALGPFWD
jgi:hypothetical protein